MNEGKTERGKRKGFLEVPEEKSERNLKEFQRMKEITSNFE